MPIAHHWVLERNVEVQTINQMEQPGGWTEEMTTLVESCFQKGQDKPTIIRSIKMQEF